MECNGLADVSPLVSVVSGVNTIDNIIDRCGGVVGTGVGVSSTAGTSDTVYIKYKNIPNSNRINK